MRVVGSAVLLLLAACSSGGESHVVTTKGLKIYVTPETHSGDFLNDSTLTGSTGVAKADDFCNKSKRKPDNAVYKALLVDGVNRDAKTNVDWVLKPNTEYFQVYDNIEIDVTTASAIFNAAFTPMKGSVCTPGLSCPRAYSNDTITGIENASDFSSGSHDCSDWSTSATSASLYGGEAENDDGRAFVGAQWSCSLQGYVYCVEQ